MEKWTDKNIDQQVEERISNWQLPFDENEPKRAKANVLARIEAPEQKSVSPNRYWFQIAAAIALLIALPLGIYNLGITKIENVTTGILSHSLPNGSVITANPGAAFSYNKYTWVLDRNVIFEGEGYFDVVPGSKFVVATPKGNIRVLGTTFSIWADSDDLLVHCSSGKVQVSNENQSELLGPGEFTSHLKDGLSPKQNLSHEGFYAPRTNLTNLNYDQTPLCMVLHELEIVLGVEIDCQLKTNTLLYSGALNTADLNSCFDILCKPFGAKHKKAADGTFVIYE